MINGLSSQTLIQINNIFKQKNNLIKLKNIYKN